MSLTIGKLKYSDYMLFSVPLNKAAGTNSKSCILIIVECYYVYSYTMICLDANTYMLLL